MRDHDSLPVRQSMKRAHKVRRFRRTNAEHGLERRWKTGVNKPWKTHNPVRTAA